MEQAEWDKLADELYKYGRHVMGMEPETFAVVLVNVMAKIIREQAIDNNAKEMAFRLTVVALSQRCEL